MKYICLEIIPFIVGLLIPMIVSLIKKSNLKKENRMNKNDFIICTSTKWAWLMIVVSSAIAAILILLNVFESSNLAAKIIVTFFVILFLFGALLVLEKRLLFKKII